MMKKKVRKRYSIEFKQEAVRFARESGLNVTQAAARLEVPLTTLLQWLDVTGGRDAEQAATFTEKEELARLRRENEQLRMERDFLKKAAAFFAKETR
jgi:transposase